jgi:hypothetical protein
VPHIVRLLQRGEITMNRLSGPADRAFANLVAMAEADPVVLGLVLHGSRAFEGMATVHSDYDAALIPKESEQAAVRAWAAEFDPDLAPAGRLPDRKSPGVDLDVVPLSRFGKRRDETYADTIDADSNRYIIGHAHVLIDRLDGQIAAIVREAATLPARSRERLPTMLDAYLNLLYRSLKSWRDDRPTEAHLDAARSIDLALWVIFTMHQRLRPPNKYLRWELQRRPLDDTAWDAAQLLGRAQRVLADGDPETQRSLFCDIESTARAVGLSETVDGWGDDLKLFRGVRLT